MKTYERKPIQWVHHWNHRCRHLRAAIVNDSPHKDRVCTFIISYLGYGHNPPCIMDWNLPLTQHDRMRFDTVDEAKQYAECIMSFYEPTDEYKPEPLP